MDVFGTIAQVQAVERAIRESGCYTMVHDGGRKVDFPWQGTPGQSAVFARVYEVYVDRRAKDYLADKDGMGLLKLFDLPTTYVRFWYSFRDQKAEVKLKTQHTTRLCAVFPDVDLALSNLLRVAPLTKEVDSGKVIA